MEEKLLLKWAALLHPKGQSALLSKSAEFESDEHTVEGTPTTCQ
jgi:hypothetical protein